MLWLFVVVVVKKQVKHVCEEIIYIGTGDTAQHSTLSQHLKILQNPAPQPLKFFQNEITVKGGPKD